MKICITCHFWVACNLSKSMIAPEINKIVGMENHLKKLNSLLARESNAVCFVGIRGMAGVGKTITARALFHELIGGFEGGCFLQNVYKKDMLDLQKSLLSEVLRARVKISDRYEGSSMIRTHLCSKRILLVLDGVDNITQLEALAGDYSWFGPGSKIIITTRDVHLLNEAEENVIYEIKTLSYSEAMELFCWHAFKKSSPAKGFIQLSNRVVRYASGLPLALVILGSYLHGLGMDVWESSLARLEEDDPQDKVFAALKFSFDELDDRQQEIFLDIACFFRGDREIEVKRKLCSFGFQARVGITALIKKSLIQILDGNIEMHDLIQEMGWSIVRQKANNEPERYTRLWNREDIIDVLMNNTGTINIEGLVLKEEGRFTLSKGAFENMSKLRLLEFYNHNFQGAPNYLPNSLRWLRWDNYPAKSLPESFKPTNLVSLELRESSILQTPDISAMLYLEVLDVSRCKKLIDVHPSVGDHKRLVHLNMSGCSVFEKFPKTIQMESLEILNLQDTNIGRLPQSLGHLTSLKEINLCGCKNLTYLPSSLCGLQYLESIALSGCSQLDYFSENPDDDAFDQLSIWRGSKMLTAFLSLPLLRKLDMANCNVLELIIPEGIGFFMPSLRELDLRGNDFISLPKSINCFFDLKVLHLEHCKMLEELPELPSSIMELFLDYCTALTRIPNLVDLLDKYEDLHRLSLLDCVQLVQKHEQKTSDSPQTQTNAVGHSLPWFLAAFWDWQSVSNVLRKRQEVLLVYLPEVELPDWLNQLNTGRPDTADLPEDLYDTDDDLPGDGDQDTDDDVPEDQDTDDDVPGDQDSDDFSEDQNTDDLPADQDTDDFQEDQDTIFPLVTVTLSPSWYNDKLRGFALCAISKAFNLEVVTCNGQVINKPIITNIGDVGSDQTAFLYIPIGKLTGDTKLKEEKECCLFEVTNIGASKKVKNFGDDTSWRMNLVYEGEVDIDISNLPYTIHPNPSPSDGAKLKVCVGAGVSVASGSHSTAGWL